MMKDEFRVLTGNEACTLGALAAGMNFFAGYPITPATEIAEYASELLPKQGGKYMQMEDELASVAAVIGASFAGAKAMTATSGPGFSLMQENIGYAMLAEVPCVLVDVMRQGPCQGVATVPAQGDLMQARWGTHGDHPVIAVAPCSVEETYYETIRAFNMAEKYRTPVFVLSDAMLAHMSEKIRIPDAAELTIENRKQPSCPKEDYRPYEDDGTEIPPMAAFGDGYHWYVSGIIHDETGVPSTSSPDQISSEVKRLHHKITRNIKDIESYEEYRTEDADIIIVSVGIVARVARSAVDAARDMGIKAGLFRPITLWPFPEERLKELADRAKTVMTCEMNEGQLIHIVRQFTSDTPVVSVTQNNGMVMEAETVLAVIKEVK